MHVLILPFSSPRNFWNFFPFSFFLFFNFCLLSTFFFACVLQIKSINFSCRSRSRFFSYSVFILLSSYYFSNFCCRLSSIDTALSSNLPSGDNFLRIRVGIRERISLGSYFSVQISFFGSSRQIRVGFRYFRGFQCLTSHVLRILKAAAATDGFPISLRSFSFSYVVESLNCLISDFF